MNTRCEFFFRIERIGRQGHGVDKALSETLSSTANFVLKGARVN